MIASRVDYLFGISRKGTAAYKISFMHLSSRSFSQSDAISLDDTRLDTTAARYRARRRREIRRGVCTLCEAADISFDARAPLAISFIIMPKRATKARQLERFLRYADISGHSYFKLFSEGFRRAPFLSLLLIMHHHALKQAHFLYAVTPYRRRRFTLSPPWLSPLSQYPAPRDG